MTSRIIASIQVYFQRDSDDERAIIAADEGEVRGHIVEFLQHINRLAPDCGLSTFQCHLLEHASHCQSDCIECVSA